MAEITESELAHAADLAATEAEWDAVEHLRCTQPFEYDPSRHCSRWAQWRIVLGEPSGDVVICSVHLVTRLRTEADPHKPVLVAPLARWSLREH